MAAALKIRDLEKSFSAFHLGPLDLTVPKGAIYGFIGPNGAGKTTTIDLIMGMGREQAGTIEVLGLDHRGDEVAVKKQVGYSSPDLIFVTWLTVRKLIEFYRGFYRDWDDAYCADLMSRLGIGWDDKIATLSYGARTKLGLILALAHKPALLLLDEPLVGLDAICKQEVFRELLDAVQDEERTVFISSHNLDDLERFADHLGIINNGKLLLEGPTSDLVERFCMVDCTASNGAKPDSYPGIRVQERDGDRCRLLLDTAQTTPETLADHGIADIATTSLTLEELFVALVKEP